MDHRGRQWDRARLRHRLRESGRARCAHRAAPSAAGRSRFDHPEAVRAVGPRHSGRRDGSGRRRGSGSQVVETLGDPLVLINSAGGNVTHRHWRNLSPAGASEVIDQDLKAMFYCTIAVLPVMRSRGDGRIVHIASQAGVSFQTVSGPSYSASKHGVLAMSASLNAEEGIHGIRSICISPGEVETPILDTRPSPPSAAERRLMLQPEDVAETAVFCVSLPPRACATQVILLPTDDRHVRDRARAIEAMTAD